MTEFKVKTGPSYNDLLDGLGRAKKQLIGSYFNRDDALRGTKWIRELLAAAEGEADTLSE